jgi:hypothetical protein
MLYNVGQYLLAVKILYQVKKAPGVNETKRIAINDLIALKLD